MAHHVCQGCYSQGCQHRRREGVLQDPRQATGLQDLDICSLLLPIVLQTPPHLLKLRACMKAARGSLPAKGICNAMHRWQAFVFSGPLLCFRPLCCWILEPLDTLCQGKSEHDAIHFHVGEEKPLPPGRALERAANMSFNETVISTQAVPVNDSADQNMLATTCLTLT